MQPVALTHRHIDYASVPNSFARVVESVWSSKPEETKEGLLSVVVVG